MADAAAEGAMGGKVVDPVVEPGRPTAGLPPPERWAKAEVLKAKIRKAQRKRGVLMTHPQDTASEVYPFCGQLERVMSGGYKDFTNEGPKVTG
jgi:hypothetical protein